MRFWLVSSNLFGFEASQLFKEELSFLHVVDSMIHCTHLGLRGSHSDDQTCAAIPTTYAAMLQEQLRNTRHPFKLLSIEKSNFEKRLRDIRDTLTTSTLTFILVSASWQSVSGSFFLVLIFKTCPILCFHNQNHGGNVDILALVALT